MKIAIATIVVNNEMLIGQWIEHYKPIADQLIIVEGATENWQSVLGWCSPRSTDRTNSIISRHSEVVHIQSKIAYKDKNEQCNEFMKVIDKDIDYVWYIDSDEFYNYEDIAIIKKELEKNEYTFVEFKFWHFWKHFDVVARGGNGWAYETSIPRIWRYHPGAEFKSHRPPTILDKNGVDYKTIKPLKAENNFVRCLHYSYMFKSNVLEKMQYYSKTFNRDYMVWYINCWLAWNKENKTNIEKKYSVHPSCEKAFTEPFTGKHPEIIKTTFNL